MSSQRRLVIPTIVELYYETVDKCAALWALRRNHQGKHQRAEGYTLYAIIRVKGEKARLSVLVNA